jgi:hypothetical protein
MWRTLADRESHSRLLSVLPNTLPRHWPTTIYVTNRCVTLLPIISSALLDPEDTPSSFFDVL